MDNVNHPAHYNTGKYESIDVMVETQGVHRFKNGTEDIKKAIWYLNKYVELNELTTDEVEPKPMGKSADAMYIDESWAMCEPAK